MFRAFSRATPCYKSPDHTLPPSMLRSPTLLSVLLALSSCTLFAQDTVRFHRKDLPEWKAAGRIPVGAVIDYLDPLPAPVDFTPVISSTGSLRSLNACDCWVEPDSSYYQVPLTQWSGGGAGQGDDGSLGPFVLPFAFNFYGTPYTRAYLNINGNVSFGEPLSTYSASGFPLEHIALVAPFWADVDLSNPQGTNNIVRYKVTPTAFYINWIDVGYYNQQQDKLNSFQLIITNGNDPVIGQGYNVSFCYRDMQWTTGSASEGVNGFGGVPATVGANLGDGVNYIQFGRYDHAGYDQYGPFGAPAGVDVLDGQHFRFNTSVGLENIPPIATSDLLCDTLRICTGPEVELLVDFLTPEQDQIISQATATAPSLPSLIVSTEDLGNLTRVRARFTPTAAHAGYHEITFSGTDNGTPAATTTVTVVVEVVVTDAAPPVIIGSTAVCPGDSVTLTANSGYNSYSWSNGATTPSIIVGAGQYVLRTTVNACGFFGSSHHVGTHPAPEPIIQGSPLICDTNPVVLSVDAFAAIRWSTGDSLTSVTVGPGSYTVAVTDNEGCSAISDPFVVTIGYPAEASFTVEPSGHVLPGTLITATASTDGDPMVSWHWHVEPGSLSGSGSVFNFVAGTSGTWTITLTVSSPDGCTDTYTSTLTVPGGPIIVPNVFSPNGDGHNDALVISGLEFHPQSELQVYNRWGQVVFASSSYKNDWSAAGLPDGTYYYLLRLRDGQELAGHVTLLR